MTVRAAVAKGLCAAAAVVAVALVARHARATPDEFTLIERGRYLATVGDCVACHTAPGGVPYAGNRDIETPFGIIKSANLTPDGATGIGRWTPDDFYRAMHAGKRPNGAYLYPAFPYPFYTKVTRADSDAIFAFLQKLPPTPNAVDRNTLPFPLNVRTAMLGWNTLFFTPGEFKPDATKSAEYNRGAYLTESLGHCGACHTPMNLLGANRSDRAFEGSNIQGWIAPNITNDTRLGLGSWSADEIVAYLHTGHTMRAAASGPMAEVVANSTATMDAKDLHAIAVYLKERGAPASAAVSPVAEADPQMQAGAAIYADTCMACHNRSGNGAANIFPQLAGNQVVQQDDPTTLVRVVLQGSRSVATGRAPTAPAMPSLGWRLTNEQVANVLTYIRNSWGNAAARVSGSQVSSIRKTF